MSNVQVFRPRANLFWGYSAISLDALYLFQALAYPTRGENLIIDFAIFALVVSASYLMWIRPKLVLGEARLLVINPIRKVEIDYREISDLETKWALLIHHEGLKTRVWVAPTNGKQRWITDSTNRWRFSKLPQAQSKGGEFASVSDSNLSDSGAAATLIRHRIASLH